MTHPNTSRRQFLTHSAAASLALALPRIAHATPPPPSAFGVQLYTVRTLLQDHPADVLAAIRAIGYRSVETYGGQYSLTAPQLRALISDAGLAIPSAHFRYEDFDSRFDYAAELGARNIVCGMAPKSIADSADGFKRAADQYNLWGEKARKANLRFAFHNHNSDFQNFNGHTGIDILLANTDPALVQWQIDCYWVAEAGLDPLTLMRQHSTRIQTLHVKDRKPGFPPSTILDHNAQHFTEVGKGTLDWKSIWDYASSIGVRYFFIEQDTTEIPPLDSLRTSYTNLKRILT